MIGNKKIFNRRACTRCVLRPLAVVELIRREKALRLIFAIPRGVKHGHLPEDLSAQNGARGVQLLRRKVGLFTRMAGRACPRILIIRRLADAQPVSAAQRQHQVRQILRAVIVLRRKHGDKAARRFTGKAHLLCSRL